VAGKPEPAGLQLRLIAAERLRGVLDGQPFQPLNAGEVPDSRDRAVGNRLITTALRYQGPLNAVIEELLDRGLPKKGGSFEAVLRLSLGQLLFLPELGAHSALFLAVEALKADPKARHLTGLMNAALRRAQANSARLFDFPEDLLFPSDLRAGWVEAYGAEAVERFGQALRDGAPLDLTLRDTDPELMAGLNAEPMVFDSVRVMSRDRPVEALPGYAEGRWWVQDTAAALPARLLQLPAGARVGDFCAAPGGKTAQLVKAGYRVTALDSEGSRLDRLRSNLARLGYAAEIVEGDAASYEPAEKFDGLLLDAPCSATGTFRRHPEVIWHRDEKDIRGRAGLQRKLLRQAAQCLNPGGVLIYCVCSLEAAEGEAQAAWVEAHLPELQRFPIAADELDRFGPALTALGEVRTHPGLALADMPPGGVDGFFIARFRRR
jgi:16S rRNA (cytosine967-C5)-methyltransferase